MPFKVDVPSTVVAPVIWVIPLILLFVPLIVFVVPLTILVVPVIVFVPALLPIVVLEPEPEAIVVLPVAPNTPVTDVLPVMLVAPVIVVAPLTLNAVPPLFRFVRATVGFVALLFEATIARPLLAVAVKARPLAVFVAVSAEPGSSTALVNAVVLAFNVPVTLRLPPTVVLPVMLALPLTVVLPVRLVVPKTTRPGLAAEELLNSAAGLVTSLFVPWNARPVPLFVPLTAA